MRHFLLAVPTVAIILLSAAVAGDAPDRAAPSYQKALRAFQAERAKADGPHVSAEDRMVMAAAARELAAAMPEPGLRVGDEAPDFALPDAFGRQVRLRDLLEDGPVVLTFYRGAWCPYCNLQLRGLQGALPAIRQEGARLVAITPQRPDKSRAQLEKDGYAFEVLSDLDDRVMKAYRLYFEVPPSLSEIYKRLLSLDLAEYNGKGRYGLPVPATFVIDRGGVVRAAFADVDYRMRMEPSAIIAALKDVNAQ